MKDLNANDVDMAMRMVEGTARGQWGLRYRVDSSSLGGLESRYNQHGGKVRVITSNAAFRANENSIDHRKEYTTLTKGVSSSEEDGCREVR